MRYMIGKPKTIVFMLLFAFLHSWTKSSKVATVLVLQNSFPVFPCIASAAMNVWPFSRYLIVIVSGPHVFTHCVRPVNRHHFLSWPLQLFAQSQMWYSLHRQINCSNVDKTPGTLRPAIASRQRMKQYDLPRVFDTNVSLSQTVYN